ncbi:hypothetical protein FB45DRAFT_1029758 [Roridomyces roridus]|uniref:Uncharacterized protein n=1 Tax=Roridomyces roridus TaxID=1738132 RepID=A0AAD7FLX2_9AGAR|nr:hypothetical protein FB45DRAFT_1029758 [Roridomyces roridus]
MSQPLPLSVCNPWPELWMKPAFSMPPTSDVTCLSYSPNAFLVDVSVACIVGVVVL